MSKNKFQMMFFGESTKQKAQKPNKAQKHMAESTNHYRELEDRTTEFAKRVIRLCKELPNNTINKRLIDQIIRSAGSVGANYREANEALGKKDLAHRLRIARKECKETEHWLILIEETNEDFGKRMEGLFSECSELRNILSAIIRRVADKEKFRN